MDSGNPDRIKFDKLKTKLLKKMIISGNLIPEGGGKATRK